MFSPFIKARSSQDEGANFFGCGAVDISRKRCLFEYIHYITIFRFCQIKHFFELFYRFCAEEIAREFHALYPRTLSDLVEIFRLAGDLAEIKPL